MINNNPVAFISVIHFPHSHIRNLKKVHRLVVLPDYQGMGIGGRFLEAIAEKYIKNKFTFGITTSNPALIWSLKKNQKWRLNSHGRISQKNNLKGMSKSASSNRMTTSWFYKADQS